MININKFSMGATAAIITSIGLIAGLNHGEHAKTSIITGLLIIAIADNISDSLGLHIYKESECASQKEINSSTFGNFITRLLLVVTFIGIVWFLPPRTAFIVSSIWGLFLLSILSYLISKVRNTNPFKEIISHLLVALVVVIGSRFLGYLILNKIN